MALYVLLPLPQSWVLLLIVGLGVALTVTVRRLRDGGGALDHAGRVIDIADRLTGAIEDRIRYSTPPPQVQAAYDYYPQPAPPQLGATPVYDAGALTNAVVAVLAAEGIPTQAAPALPAVTQLLSWAGIATAPGAPAPAARALASGLGPGGRRYQRTVPLGLFATCLTAILVTDGVLPAQLTSGEADALIEGSTLILHALAIAPDHNAGSAHDWPVIGQIITAAPRHQPRAW